MGQSYLRMMMKVRYLDHPYSTSMFDQIGHTPRFEDDRYQADIMVRRVTNLEVVA